MPRPPQDRISKPDPWSPEGRRLLPVWDVRGGVEFVGVAGDDRPDALAGFSVALGLDTQDEGVRDADAVGTLMRITGDHELSESSKFSALC